jgi:hypothetical protein
MRFGIQHDFFSDIHKNVIKAKYFKSLQPESRITKIEVDKINKIINEKVKSQHEKSNTTNFNSK